MSFLKKIPLWGYLLASAIVLSSCGSSRPITVVPVNHLAAGHNKQGLYYSLPRTVLTIDVTIEKTEEIPGPFHQYAERFLSIDNVINQPSSIYEITDISFGSYAEVDPSAFYFVEVDRDINAQNPLTLTYSPAGFLSGVNTYPGMQENTFTIFNNRLRDHEGNEVSFRNFMEKNLHEKVDTIVEMVRMDTVTIERQTLRRTWVEKTSEVRAQEVAEYILNIREKRFDLISGFAEITYAKEAIAYMNEQMLKMENEYLELFTGMRTSSKKHYRFYFVPEKDQAGEPVTLFHFNRRKGMLQEADAISEPVNLTVARDYSTRQMGVFTLDPVTDKATLDQGFFYRIPENAKITLDMYRQPLAEKQLTVNQYGIITSLPPEDLKIQFYPSTGALKSVERLDNK